MSVARLALLCLLLPAALPAQIQTGQRLRVRTTTAPEPLIGTLLSFSTDTLILQTADDTLPLGIRTIQRVEVSRGMGHAGGRGAKIGAFVGVPAGAILGVVAHQSCTEDDACFYEEPLPEIVGGAFFGGLAGAGLGYIIGSTKRREQWKEASLNVAFTGTAVRVAVRF
jgi:hypothetical protein